MIEILITSSILILFICLIRWLLKGRISSKLQYSLWAIVAIRLILPWVTISNSTGYITTSVSVMNLYDRVFEQMTTQDSLKPLVDNLTYGHVFKTEEPVSVLVKAAAIDWQLVLGIVWIIGFLFLFYWICSVNYRFYCFLKENRKLFHNTVGITTLPVYIVENLKSPCYFGLFGQEAIYITPKAASDDIILKHVLTHEACHAAHHDLVWGWIRCGLLCFYWINPFIWLAAYLSKQDCELACDESAVLLLGKEERYAYGRTLLTLVGEKTKAADIFQTATTMNSRKEILKKRILILIKSPKTTAVTVFFLMIILISIVFVTFTSSKKKEQQTTQNTLINKEKIQYEPASWNEDTQVGNEGLILDYADNNLVIFHDYFGMFFYSLSDDTGIYGLDLASIGCNATQGDTALEVQVSKDGTIVYLHPMNQDTMYIYETDTRILYEEKYISMEKPFNAFVPIETVLGDIYGTVSYHAVKLDTGEYLYLSYEDWSVKNAKIHVGEKEYPIFELIEPSVPKAEIIVNNKLSAFYYGLHETDKSDTYKLTQQFKALIEKKNIISINAGDKVEIRIEDKKENKIVQAEVATEYWLDEEGNIHLYNNKVHETLEEVELNHNVIGFTMSNSMSALLSSTIVPEKILRGITVKIIFENGNTVVYYFVAQGTKSTF